MIKQPQKVQRSNLSLHSITLCGLHQIINKPAHVLENSLSCLDLIFTSQPNLMVDSGVHPSLHPNCYHQNCKCKI